MNIYRVTERNQHSNDETEYFIVCENVEDVVKVKPSRYDQPIVSIECVNWNNQKVIVV